MKNPYRWLIYGLGMAVLAFGITLNTKAGLGVSPSVSYRNEPGNLFWEKLGFTIREDPVCRNLSLTEMERIGT